MAAEYTLTEAHRAQLAPWADRWIANAMSTAPMDDTDRAAMRVAVRGLYEAAGLTPPPDHRIVFVPSPFVLRFAGGFAAAIWYRRKQQAATEAATWDATRDATLAATRAATWDATRDATLDATLDATRDATRDATWAATEAATLAATRAATVGATEAATLAATRDATVGATEAATRAATRDATWYRYPTAALVRLAHVLGGEDAGFLVACAQQAWRMWNGGNQWSGYVAFVSFFRHVVHLPIDYTQFAHYEAAAIHAGPRIMHAEFCMVSDRPEVLLVDAEHRPHCDDGPFCRWRDGTALYAVHGVRVPWDIIEHPESVTLARIQAETNAEVRRVMLERYGVARYLHDAGARVLDASDHGTLYRAEMADDEPLVMVGVENSTPEPDGTRKQYFLRVPPDTTRAVDAVAWTFGLSAADYVLTAQT